MVSPKGIEGKNNLHLHGVWIAFIEGRILHCMQCHRVSAADEVSPVSLFASAVNELNSNNSAKTTYNA